MRGFGSTDKDKSVISALVNIPTETRERARFEREWQTKFGGEGQYYQWEGGLGNALADSLTGSAEESALELYSAEGLSEGGFEQASSITGQSVEKLRAKVKQIQPLNQQFKGGEIPAPQRLKQAECGPEGAGYRLCVPLPGESGHVADLGDYIKLIYQFALAIAGIVAFGVIVYGGILYTLSAGSITSQSDARETITQAIYGLILLLAAVLILYIINPNLLKFGGELRGRGELNLNLDVLEAESARIKKAALIRTREQEAASLKLLGEQTGSAGTLTQEITRIEQELEDLNLTPEERGLLTGALTSKKRGLNELQQAIQAQSDIKSQTYKEEMTLSEIKELHSQAATTPIPSQ